MLFTYPVAATANNWLHDALRAAVESVHLHALAGTAVPPWPDILPVSARTRLTRRRALRDRLSEYGTAAIALSAAQHQQVLNALRDQNRIEELLQNACDCERSPQLPACIQDPAAKLFTEGFRLLSEFGTRDEQYKAIYEALASKVCPFCGCEYFDAPEAPREALDHYLAKSIYPFAGANLRNLAPIGAKCNSTYKKNKDVIADGGVRRKAFDPYRPSSAGITLRRSVPFAGTGGDCPQWHIDFVPASQEAVTWDAVLEIRTRFSRDVLDPNFKSWLGEFAAWCKRANQPPTDATSLDAALDGYIMFLCAMGYDDRGFLKLALFEFLKEHCGSGDKRVIELLIDIADLVT